MELGGKLAPEKSAVPVDYEVVFDRVYGGRDFDRLMAVRALLDGGALAAGYRRAGKDTAKNKPIRLWVVRTDARGDVLWQRTINTPGDYAMATAMDHSGDGSFLIAGQATCWPKRERYFKGIWCLNGFLLKIDAMGKVLWNRRVGAPGFTELKSVDCSGNLCYVAGTYRLAKPDVEDAFVLIVTNDGNIEQRTFHECGLCSARAVAAAGDGGLVVAGEWDTKKGDTSRAWLLRLNRSGKKQWQVFLGKKGFQSATTVLSMKNDDVVAGIQRWPAEEGDKYDVVIARFDPQGNVIWERVFDKGGYHGPHSISPAGMGGVMVAGALIPENQKTGTGYDSWLLRLDARGGTQWERLAGGLGEDAAMDVDVLSNGDVIAAGFHDNSTDTPCKPPKCPGGWIAKFKSTGKK